MECDRSIIAGAQNQLVMVVVVEQAEDPARLLVKDLEWQVGLSEVPKLYPRLVEW